MLIILISGAYQLISIRNICAGKQELQRIFNLLVILDLKWPPPQAASLRGSSHTPVGLDTEPVGYQGTREHVCQTLPGQRGLEQTHNSFEADSSI